MVSQSGPFIEVGVVKAENIHFKLNGSYTIRDEAGIRITEGEAVIEGDYVVLVKEGKHLHTGSSIIFEPGDPGEGTFVIQDVVIGVGFHWEQKEIQVFQGALKLMASGNAIQVVNIVSVEDYLISVISSEMSGDSAPALLKAHTIISRSWLLAQILKQERLEKQDQVYKMIHESAEEYIRWYDREDHQKFHVCADDHCQRYQGITRANNPEVVKAVRETEGEVIEYEGNICDARFSKCCGGVVEEFEYCWEPIPHPYLQRVDDNPAGAKSNSQDLKIESNAVDYIKSAPEAFCNTDDAALLNQVLNDYDKSLKNFYRWKVTYSQEELSAMIREKSGIDFGNVIDMVPVERGESGRLVKLKIVGTARSLTIGKELEIRRWLSSSHLYSSAFIVERQDLEHGIPGSFILHGAGWGHGVGLCQIGAAVMASRGYSHQEILAHYFKNTTIEKPYE